MKSRMLMLFLAGIAIYTPHTIAGTVSKVTFEDKSANKQYTDSDVKKDWPKAGGRQGVKQGRTQITSNGIGKTGKALRVKYPKGKFVSGSGAQWKQNFKGHDELYASYYVFFPKNWDPKKGGKLPGLCGGKCPAGGSNIKGDTGFSARYMFKAGDKLSLYFYHMGQSGKYADNFYLKGGIKRNKWIKLTQRIKLNTPNKKNGEIQVWIDNKQALSLKNLQFRTTSKVQIDKFFFSTFYGGGSKSYAPTKDEVIYFDNFEIYTKGSNTIKQTLETPKNLHITASGQVQLEWTPTADTSGYAVYQKKTPKNSPVPQESATYNLLEVITQPETTSLSLETPPAGEIHQFAITAFNDAGEESNLSNEVSMTTDSEALPLAVVQASSDAMSDDSNSPANVLDGNFNTLWVAEEQGQWLKLDLGTVHLVDQVAIRWFQSDVHTAVFNLEISTDGEQWVPILSDQHSGNIDEAFEAFTFSPVEARYVRYTDLGQSSDTWSGVSEIEVYASSL